MCQGGVGLVIALVDMNDGGVCNPSPANRIEQSKVNLSGHGLLYSLRLLLCSRPECDD